MHPFIWAFLLVTTRIALTVNTQCLLKTHPALSHHQLVKTHPVNGTHTTCPSRPPASVPSFLPLLVAHPHPLTPLYHLALRLPHSSLHSACQHSIRPLFIPPAPTFATPPYQFKFPSPSTLLPPSRLMTHTSPTHLLLLLPIPPPSQGHS